MEKNPSDEIGKFLYADKLIYGAYIIYNSQIRIDIKINEVRSGRILAAFTFEGKIDNIFELEKQLVRQIHNSLNFKENIKS